MDSRPRVTTQVLITICASGNAFLIGIVFSWSNPMHLKLLDGDAGFPVDETDMSWISTLFALGAGIFLLPIGFLTDAIGAKMVLLSSFLPTFIGWAFIVYAQNVTWLFVGRFILGISTGACCVATPIYVAEIAHKNLRGRLCELVYFDSVIGSIYVYVIGAFMSVFMTSVYCVVCVIVVAFCSLFLRQTPVFLYSRKKETAAIKSLKFFRGNNYNIQDEIIDLIENEKQMEIRKQIPLMEALTRRVTIKGLFICCGLMTFKEGSGFGIFLLYSTKIFNHSKSNIDEYIGTILIGFMELIGSIFSILLIDYFGRRFLLFCSAAIMSLSLYALSAYFVLLVKYPDVARKINWLPIAMSSIYILMLSFGFGPISWLMLGEIFSVDVKGIAVSLVVAYNWFIVFTCAKCFIYLEKLLSFGWTFFGLGSVAVIAIIFVLFVVPETKGKTLNEVHAELMKRKSQIKN